MHNFPNGPIDSISAFPPLFGVDILVIQQSGVVCDQSIDSVVVLLKLEPICGGDEKWVLESYSIESGSKWVKDREWIWNIRSEEMI